MKVFFKFKGYCIWSSLGTMWILQHRLRHHTQGFKTPHCDSNPLASFALSVKHYDNDKYRNDTGDKASSSLLIFTFIFIINSIAGIVIIIIIIFVVVIVIIIIVFTEIRSSSSSGSSNSEALQCTRSVLYSKCKESHLCRLCAMYGTSWPTHVSEIATEFAQDRSTMKPVSDKRSHPWLTAFVFGLYSGIWAQ